MNKILKHFNGILSAWYDDLKGYEEEIIFNQHYEITDVYYSYIEWNDVISCEPYFFLEMFKKMYNLEKDDLDDFFDSLEYIENKVLKNKRCLKTSHDIIYD